MTWTEMYDFLRDVIGVHSDALDLAFSLCGSNTSTAENILWYYTGYRSFEQYTEDYEQVTVIPEEIEVED